MDTQVIWLEQLKEGKKKFINNKINNIMFFLCNCMRIVNGKKVNEIELALRDLSSSCPRSHALSKGYRKYILMYQSQAIDNFSFHFSSFCPPFYVHELFSNKCLYMNYFPTSGLYINCFHFAYIFSSLVHFFFIIHFNFCTSFYLKLFMLWKFFYQIYCLTISAFILCMFLESIGNYHERERMIKFLYFMDMWKMKE
ncbi:hypothetical protein RFI_28276 [Reticulomyxa filosa]|uniref:Uncharacterized protein n=1 Tax=Reticulomyxa filosa TaxID=46433 RepID=X6M6M3_RETFI|nr:hypothetical protein RFI_28276 [Reticulomyxa filosa]|eukprot:ETO09112.1 hypothetical protein RFI_28276 [Reticulomyxa filosa]